MRARKNSEVVSVKDARRLTDGAVSFLLATLVTGLVFRSQLAGWLTGDLGLNLSLDLRRAHSHLGFYGVLFPISWVAWRASGVPIPRGRWLLFYLAMVILSGVGFLLQGYGLTAIVASTGILGVWLQFAWSSFHPRDWLKKDWLACVSPSIYLSSLLIVGVAVMSKRDPVLTLQLARSFLTLLLFGVVVPSQLHFLGAKAPRAAVWILAAGASAVSLTELHSSLIFSLGPVWLGSVILISLGGISRRKGDLRLHLHWALFALGMVGTGLRLIPHTHPVAIAGVHYLVLGPVLIGFALTQLRLRIAPVIRGFYELSVIGMVTSIGLQAFLSGHSLFLQRSAAVFGALVLALVVFVFAMTFRTTPCELRAPARIAEE